MGMFSKKGKNKAPADYSYILSSGFRGFKKFPIVVFGDREAEQNNEALNGTVLPGRRISFSPVENGPKRLCLQIFVDGEKVGTVFDDKQVADVISGNIEAVYAKHETENVVCEGNVETRHRIRLFVKKPEINNL